MTRPLYVETLVRADLDRLWQLTQDATQHTRWDLRFGLIEAVEAPDGSGAAAFRYSTGLGPVRISGTGTNVGEHTRPDGTRTSALRFASEHPLSPIRRGQGWWRYVPTPDGVRFLTGYDYTASWGRGGAVLDRFVVRPLMGWGTAWSFDRLRIWLEDGVTPEASRVRGLADGLARLGLVAVAAAALVRQPGATSGLGTVLAVVAATSVPPPRGVPRAGRCARAARDEAGRRAPATLRRLREPA